MLNSSSHLTATSSFLELFDVTGAVKMPQKYSQEQSVLVVFVITVAKACFLLRITLPPPPSHADLQCPHLCFQHHKSGLPSVLYIYYNFFHLALKQRGFLPRKMCSVQKSLFCPLTSCNRNPPERSLLDADLDQCVTEAQNNKDFPRRLLPNRNELSYEQLKI